MNVASFHASWFSSYPWFLLNPFTTLQLLLLLARNSHEVWATERMAKVRAA